MKNFYFNLEDKTLYTIIPFISVSCKTDDPFLTLSKQIILSKYSNYLTVNKFILNKLDVAIEQFMIDKE